MQAYRDLAERHPSFRRRQVLLILIAKVIQESALLRRSERVTCRSETTDLIVEISLQPWRSFRPDGVILFRWITHMLAFRGRPLPTHCLVVGSDRC